MGEGSRAALASHGINETNARIFCPDRSSDSDSESLLRALDLPSLKGREVVIFRAETGRELLADALSANDIRVSKVIAYRRVAARLTEHTKNALSELTRPGMIWVISSSEALHYLVSMLQKRFGIAHLDMLAHLTVWVSHPRIAENAKKCGFKHIDVMGSGDENLLLALQSWSQQRSSFYER
jgi:uroporphyrinogen-III synthase